MKGCIVVLKNGSEFDFPNCWYAVNESGKEVELYNGDGQVALWLYDAIAGIYNYEM